MSDKTITATVSILLAVIGVAVISLLVSRQANTAGIFGSLGSTFSNVLCKALSPVTGKSCGGTSVTSTISY